MRAMIGPIPSISVSVIDQAGGALAGAQVDFQGAMTETDGTGIASTLWESQTIVVKAAFPGFHEATANLEVFSDDPLEIMLEPVVLTGRVTDATGNGLTAAKVRLGDVEAVTGDGTEVAGTGEPTGGSKALDSKKDHSPVARVGKKPSAKLDEKISIR